MPDSDSDQRRRRHRRRRRSSSQAKPGLWGGNWFAPGLAGAMALCAVGLVGTNMLDLHRAAQSYGPLAKGTPQAELRYAQGAPHTIGPEGQWVFRRDGVEMQTWFDPAGRLERVRCNELADAAQTCPGVLGVGIGSSEGDVIAAFGRPTAVRLAQGSKFAQVAALGLELELREARVVAIHHRMTGTPAAQWALALLRSLP